MAVGEKWYAIVAADEEALDGVQLINISDPAKPKPAGVAHWLLCEDVKFP